MANQLQKTVQKNEMSLSDRFTNKMIEIYSDVQKGFQLTDNEKQLIAGYYIKCDEALRKQNIKWKEIDMNTLAMDLVNKARLGLDMQMPNHLFPIPFRSKKDGTVTLNLITGYEGEKHKRLKFSSIKPIDMKVELVYSNDKFIPQKTAQGDTYILEIKNPFDRGEIVGGIGYIQYEDSRKNILIIMSVKDILKRKPPYAKDEFWEKWKEKMYTKTIMRELCTHIPLDADKVREYNELCKYEEAREIEIAKQEADNMIIDNANNGEIIDIVEPTGQVIDVDDVAMELSDEPDFLK